MNRISLFFYSTVFLLIVRLLPLINNYINFPELLIVIIYIGICVILFPKAFSNKRTFIFISFFIIIFLLLYLKGWNSFYWHFTPITDWFNSLAIFNVLIYINNKRIFKRITIVAIAIIFINLVISLPQVIYDPSILRNSMNNFDSPVNNGGFGLIGYSFLHSLPVLFPMMILLFKKCKGVKKSLWLIFTFAIYYLIVKSSFGTILIISTVLIPISFLLSDKLKKNYFILSFGLLVVIFSINENIILSTIDNAMPFFKNTHIENKLIDISESINAGDAEGQVKGRAVLYKESWTSFFANPFFGTFYEDRVGGHAMIPDFLAKFGLVGTIPLILFFYYTFKRGLGFLNKKYMLNYLLCLTPYIILSFVKGTSSFSQFFVVLILPIGLSLMLPKKRSNIIKIEKHENSIYL